MRICFLFIFLNSLLFAGNIPKQYDPKVQRSALNNILPAKFKNFTKEAKAFKSGVFSITSDPSGILYYLTSAGAYRYDGYEWTQIYDNLKTEYGDAKYILYTNNWGLLIGTSNGVVQWKENAISLAPFNQELSGENIHKIKQTPAGDLTFIFSGSANDPQKPGGITLYNNSKKEWLRLSTHSGLPSNECYDYYSDGKQTFLSCRKGLFTKKKNQWVLAPQIGNKRIYQIGKHSTLGIFFCESNPNLKPSKIYFFNKGKFQSIKKYSFASRQFHPALVDKSNNQFLFIGRQNNTQKILGAKKAPRNTIVLEPHKSYLPSISKSIWAMHQSDNNDYWVGTSDHLFFKRKTLNGFFLFNHLPPVKALSKSENMLWLGSEKITGLLNLADHIYRPKHFDTTLISKAANNEVWLLSHEGLLTNSSQPEDPIHQHNISESTQSTLDPDGISWFWEKAPASLHFIDKQNQYTKSILSFDQNDKIIDLIADNKHGIWLAIQRSNSFKTELFHIDSSNKIRQKDTFNSGYTQIAISQTGDFWVFARDTLYRKKPEEDFFEKVPTFPKTNQCSIYTDSQQTLFSYRSDEKWHIKRLRADKWDTFHHEMLSGKIIHTNFNQQIIFASANNRALIFLNWQQDVPAVTFKTIGAKPLIYDKDSFIKQGSSLWFNARNINGSEFFPVCYTPSTHPPQTYFRNPPLNGREDQDYSIFLKSIDAFTPIKDQNTPTYSWKINDQAWSPFRKLENNYLNLGLLPTQKYTLQVRSKNDEGLIDDSPAIHQFEINGIPLQERQAFPYAVGAIILAIALLATIAILKAIATHKANASLTQEMAKRRLAQQELKKSHDQLETRVNERTKDLVKANEQIKEAHHTLMQTSRQAGMAEIATGILHNVGNILNSLNVSVSMAEQNLRDSKLKGLDKLNQLIQQHKDEPNLLTEHPKGKLIPDYLAKMAEISSTENQKNCSVIEEIGEHIAHIKDIVKTQQTYARVTTVMEDIDINECINSALKLNSDAFENHDLHINKKLAEIPVIACDRSKILQVLVNILGNAKDACLANDNNEKMISIRTQEDGTHVQIFIQDTGQGIASEHIDKIFNHGFTTKKTGHGFGLHNSANAIKELKGNLTVTSEGIGHGATFCISLPMAPQPVEKSKR